MMNKKIILIAVLFILTAKAPVLAQFPQTEISNGLIKVKLYLPDAVKGYYRGTRFDWSGVVASLEYNGHNYFGKWYDNHDPKKHDAITGPVEGFDPLGFETAKTGATFVKIGVGTLKRPDDKPYRFSIPYEIVNSGNWKIRKKKDRVEFTHTLKDNNGYAYVYKKTLRLTKGKPELVLEHSLKNTGLKKIEANVFDHNFFMIDNQPSGPVISVQFPFKLEPATATGGKGLLYFEDKKLTYSREITQGGEYAQVYLKGFSDRIEDYDIKINNSNTGAGVRITADKPLSNFLLWSIRSTVCPEPYIKVTAEPGKEFNYRINYQFYTESKN